MLRYQSRRHRYLMDESEQALSDAVGCDNERDSRIATQILGDDKIHMLWESRHADLVLPVAEQSKRDAQIFELRDIEVKLLHRRALVRYLRSHNIVGAQRDRLLAVFYGPKDSINAILAEHRQYTLAVSSRLSADHLINVMHDPVSVSLLGQYATIYSKYFELYCFTVLCKNKIMEDAARTELVTLRRCAMRMIKRIHTEPPQQDQGHSDFEHEALLARSGRYPIQDYMVG